MGFGLVPDRMVGAVLPGQRLALRCGYSSRRVALQRSDGVSHLTLRDNRVPGLRPEQFLQQMQPLPAQMRGCFSMSRTQTARRSAPISPFFASASEIAKYAATYARVDQSSSRVGRRLCCANASRGCMSVGGQSDIAMPVPNRLFWFRYLSRKAGESFGIARPIESQ